MAIYKDKKKNTYTVRYHQSKGKTFVKRGFKTRKEAQKYEASLKDKGPAPKTPKTFEQVIDELCDTIYIFREDRSTYNETRSMFKLHFVGFFPVKKELSNITDDDVEKYVAKLLMNGRSNNTVNKAIEIVKRVFNYSIKKRYVYINPAAYFTKLKHPKKPKQFLNYKEFCSLISTISDPKRLAMYYVLFFNGIRIGELRGIQWRDVDFYNLTLHINKHIVEPGNRNHKSVDGRKNSDDYFSEIDPETAAKLRSWYFEAKKEDGWNSDFYVFGGKKPYGRTTISRWIKEDVANVGIPKTISPHSFRHSCVSFLYNYSNLKENEIAERIHDTVEVVKKTYAHIFKAKKGKYANAIKEAKEKAEETDLFGENRSENNAEKKETKNTDWKEKEN